MTAAPAMTSVATAARDVARVVFLLPILDVGGAERTILRSAMGFDRSRFAPTVVAMVKRSDRLANELDAAGIPTVVLDTGTRPRLRQLYRLFRWLGANQPDVVLSYMFHANVAARVMRRLGTVPAVVCSERSASESGFRVRLHRFTVPWMDAMTVNSVASRRYWSRQLAVSEDRISVIRNGVDTATYCPGPSASEPIIGVLARLHPINGHVWLLDALARLDALVPEPWTCHLAGAGPSERALRAQVGRLGLDHRVRFRGHCTAPVAFLQSVMIAVHPALASGMPNAVLEAMACGLPVVATSVGGTPEAIESDETGWLVEPGDTEETALRLASLLRNPDARRTVGERARAKIVDEFGEHDMILGLENLLMHVLARSPHSTS